MPEGLVLHSEWDSQPIRCFQRQPGLAQALAGPLPHHGAVFVSQG